MVGMGWGMIEVGNKNRVITQHSNHNQHNRQKQHNHNQHNHPKQPKSSNQIQTHSSSHQSFVTRSRQCILPHQYQIKAIRINQHTTTTTIIITTTTPIPPHNTTPTQNQSQIQPSIDPTCYQFIHNSIQPQQPQPRQQPPPPPPQPPPPPPLPPPSSTPIPSTLHATVSIPIDSVQRRRLWLIMP